MRVAIYARVSKDDQSPDMQIASLQEFVNQNNYVLQETYVDWVTGNMEKKIRKTGTTRYDQMLRDAETGDFDCLLVWKYDRFARSLTHLVAALRRFEELKINFISYTQKIDTTTSHGKLFFYIIASFAEFERELTSERTRAGLKLAASRGVKLGQPEKYDQQVKDRLIRRYSDGDTLAAIAKSEKMSINTVYAILKRTVCRLPCKHGKYRCKPCRKSRRVPLRSVTAKNAGALG